MTNSRRPAMGALALLLALGASAAAQPAPSDGEFRGVLTAIWGDPQPGRAGGGGVQITLTYPDGTRVPVEVAPNMVNFAAGLSGRRVLLCGALAGDRTAPRIRARSIEAFGPATGRTAR